MVFGNRALGSRAEHYNWACPCFLAFSVGAVCGRKLLSYVCMYRCMYCVVCVCFLKSNTSLVSADVPTRLFFTSLVLHQRFLCLKQQIAILNHTDTIYSLYLPLSSPQFPNKNAGDTPNNMLTENF